MYVYVTQLVQAQFNYMYHLSMLFCLTPSGMIPVHELSQDGDYRITNDVLTLNPANIKNLGFYLSQPAPMDQQKSVSLHDIHRLFDDASGRTEPFSLYVPANQQGENVPCAYYTDMIVVPLPAVAVSTLPISIAVDPLAMTLNFVSSLTNIHMHAKLDMSYCPGEQIISARIKF